MYYYKLLDEETKQIDSWTESEEQASVEGFTLSTPDEPIFYKDNWYLKGFAPTPSIDEQNEVISHKREQYRELNIDTYTLRRSRKQADGTWTPEEETIYLDKVKEVEEYIVNNFPYVTE